MHIRSCLRELPFDQGDSPAPFTIAEEAPSQGSLMFVLSRHPKGCFYDLIIAANEISQGTGLELLKILEGKDLSPCMPFIVFGTPGALQEAMKNPLPENAFLMEAPVTAAGLKETLEKICVHMVMCENRERKREIEGLMAGLAAGKKIVNFPSQLDGIYIASASKILHLKKHAPWHYLPYLSLAQIYTGCNRYDAVIPYAKTAISLNPECADGHKLLALAYKKTGRSFEELEELLEIRETNPTSSMISMRIGEAYLREGNYREAERFFLESISKYTPEEESRVHARMYVGLGKAHIAAADDGQNGSTLQKAKDEFRTALKIYPLLMAAYNNLILVYKKLGEYGQATRIMALAVDITPNTAEDWGSMFEIFLADGDEEKAKFCLNKAIRFDPENQIIICTAAEAYVRQGIFAEALSLFERAAEVNPSDPRLYNFLGICSRQLNRHQLAIGYYHKALKLDPNDPGLHFNLGTACLNAGEKGAARREYETALKLSPDFNEAREALGNLSTQQSAQKE